MGSFARWLARYLWLGMLWLMRRPWMKQLQWASLRLFPERSQPRARESFIRQNRFARRYGLSLLTLSINLLLASIVITGTYFLVLSMSEAGLFNPPKSSASH